MAEDQESSDRTGGSKAENDRSERNLPVAHVRATPWRGWIWSVPLAAMILVGFLAVRTWLFWGPTVTVTFPEVHGLNPRGTSVIYRGVQIGTLETLELTDHGHDVKATLSMDSSVAGLLRKGTKFWINQPDIFSGDLAGLISGPDIEMMPGRGNPTRKFQGLLHPPDIEPDLPGTTFTVDTRRLGNLHRGSQVLYHGLTVGELLGWSYDADRGKIQLKVFIHTPFDRLVTGRVRFWRQGAFNIAFHGSGLNVDIPPLAGILKGAIAFDTARRAPPAPIPAFYHLYSDKAGALDAFFGPSVMFATRFTGSAAELHGGAPVKLDGMPVGQVCTVSLQYDPQQQRMTVPVTFALYPKQFGIHTGANQSRSSTAVLDKMMAQLVDRGLRAQLTSSSLLLGGKEISLVMAGKAGGQILRTAANIPEIPAVSGGGFTELIASINRISSKINNIPLEDIGQNLKKLSARLNALAASPEIRESLAHMDKTLGNAQAITGSLRGRILPTVISIRKTADAAAVMAKTITRITGGGPDTQEDLQHLVAELTRTARAVRSLANYLNRHPEALIQGRSR